jgi:hypothetical protein
MDFEIRYYLGDKMLEKIFNLSVSHEDELSRILTAAKKCLNSIYGEKRFVLLRVKSFNMDQYKGPLPKSIQEKYYVPDTEKIATISRKSSIKDKPAKSSKTTPRKNITSAKKKPSMRTVKKRPES